MRSLSLFIGLLIVQFSWAQPSPGSKQNQSILLLGGTVHIGNGDKIEEAAVGFEDGKITFVASDKNVDLGAWDKIVKTEDMHIYPGIIAMNSTLGLQEIGAVRATRDQYEVGNYNSNIRSIISYNTDSEITPTVRSNGVLLGQITPRGGVISGNSSLVHFDAWNWEDAVLKMDDGIHINWPFMYYMKSESGKRNVGLSDDYKKNVQELTSFFKEAKAYAEGDFDEVDLRMEAMKGVFDGSKSVFIHANDIKQINAAVGFKKDMGIKRVSIVGGADSYLAADLLRENEISVVLRRIHERPIYTDDDYDLPFRLPKLLQDEGVLFCLENSGDMEQMGSRNIPFYAGTAVAYGLTYEQGVQSITLSPAKILGVDDRMGSIEEGKDATLFVSVGDALDMRSNHVIHAFVQGRELDLNNRQKELYRKFQEKYQD